MTYRPNNSFFFRAGNNLFKFLNFITPTLLQASSFNPRRADSVSHDHLQKWRRGTVVGDAITFTAHTQKPSCSRSSREFSALLKNDKGGRALLTALPWIFRLHRDLNQQPFTCSQKPAYTVVTYFLSLFSTPMPSLLLSPHLATLTSWMV